MSEVLLSQLAHVEIVSPKPEESVRWFVDVLGLELTTQEGQSAYLRGWGEWLHSSLIVTEGPAPALGHIGWRTYGPGDVETIAGAIDPELAEGWVEDSVGHGRSFRFRAPMGHLNEVFWETELYEAPPELATDMRAAPAALHGPRRRRALHRPRHDQRARAQGRDRLVSPEPRPPPHRLDHARAGRPDVLDAHLQRDPLDARPRAGARRPARPRAREPRRLPRRPEARRRARRRRLPGQRHADRVRPRHPRHGRDHLPLRARAGRAADRDQLGRLAELHARLGRRRSTCRTRARRRTSATSTCPTR